MSIKHVIFTSTKIHSFKKILIMKNDHILTVFLILLLCSSPLFLFAQTDVESDARNQAETEFSTLNRRGWEAYEGDLKEMLLEAWTCHYIKDENDEFVHVRSYGSGSGSTPQEAVEEAIMNAREFVSGPITLYFQSWNADKRYQGQITEEEASIIRSAINDAEEQIRHAILELETAPQLAMFQERRNRYRARARIYYNQPGLRDVVRNIIADQLMESAGWPREKSIPMLTYTHK